MVLIAHKPILTVVLCAGIGMLLPCFAGADNGAEAPKSEPPKYVGAEVCSTCHKDIAKKWALTVHRRMVFNKDVSKGGCEACHGPGSAHVAAGGGRGTMRRPDKLSPREASEVCLRCHTQDRVILWPSSRHARAKVTCVNCHDPHSLESGKMLQDIDAAKLDIEGLDRGIKQAQLAADIAAKDSKEKADAQAQVDRLKAEREELRDKLRGQETAYEKVAEPYLCYNCHKTKQAQTRMVSHHPIAEGKVKCSDCHNPHGGPHGMLNQDSVTETCYRCHAEKEGPFTFEHPPVNEDCTICHNPHGAPRNNLLVQSQPFLCLKCHAGPHSRSNTLGTARTFAKYYTECTRCHNQIHGSDRHQAFHY